MPSEQRQQIALHAFAAHVGAAQALAAGNLVDLVEEHDAVVLDRADRLLHQRVLIQELVGFLGHQQRMRLARGEPARLGAAAHGLAENVAERNRAHLRAGHAGDFEHRHAALARGHLDFDLLVVEFAGAQLLAKRIARGQARVLPDQRVEHALLGVELRPRLHVAPLALAHLRDADLDQVAHDRIHVAADITDLGELGRLDLEKRRARELGQPARNLRLADAGRADHQNIFRQHFLAQLVVELQPPPAVAQRDGDRALGVLLADDIAVELGHDLARGEALHVRVPQAYVYGHFPIVSTTRLRLV